MKTASSRVLTLVAVILLGCLDRNTGTEPNSRTPRQSCDILGGMRGTVDALAGTLTFEPLSSPSALCGGGTGINAAIYGDQGVTVRIYNSPVSITNPSSPGKKTFSANVGVRNLLAFAIGDEQVGIPADTMGIFVFVNSGPTVGATSSPCSPSCSVTVKNHHGLLEFTAPAQRYWHWTERVGAAGGGSDTTRARKSWVFEADTQVTTFTFDVLVSAAWPPPNETRWKITYPGDSIPHTTAEPRWRRITSGTVGTITLNSPSPGIMTMTTPDNSSHYFARRDSLMSTTNAYIEARFRRNNAGGDSDVSFGIDDNNKFIAVGLSEIEVGFLKQDYGFISNRVATTTLSFHTYQIRKFAADSVQLFLDGVRVDSKLYSALENSSAATIPSFFYFGIPGIGAPPKVSGLKSSSWDYVVYEIGVVQP